MNAEDVSARKKTVMLSLQAGVDLNLIASNSSRIVLESAPDATLVWASHTRKQQTAESRM